MGARQFPKIMHCLEQYQWGSGEVHRSRPNVHVFLVLIEVFRLLTPTLCQTYVTWILNMKQALELPFPALVRFSPYQTLAPTVYKSSGHFAPF